MLTKLLMSVVVVTIDRCLLERAVHPLHLTIRPGVIGFGQPMFDAMFGTDAVKQQGKSVAIRWAISKLDAVVGQNGVDFIGNCGNQVTQELGSDRSGHTLVQLDKCELGSPVNRDE